MKICITGSSGFIGQSLIKMLSSQDHELIPVNRNLLSGPSEGLINRLHGSDAVINLAGAPIMQRWTTKSKKQIYSSRIDTTLKLTDAIREIPEEKRPVIFISASAVGIYQAGITHNESSLMFDRGFTGTVVSDWEKASELLLPSVRRVIFRTGVVLGKESQTMQRLLPFFRLGIGGKIGSGKQAFPFIHIYDLCRAFQLALEDNTLTGIYNLVAPEAISNSQFTHVLANQLHRPAFCTVPAFALKLGLGNASSLLLEGATIVPQRLQKAGFHYQYPTIEKALHEIISN